MLDKTGNSYFAVTKFTKKCYWLNWRIKSAKSLYKNYDKGKSDTADFSNLIINVEYEGKQHTFGTVLLSQNVRNGLKNNDRAVVFKISRNKLDVCFDLLVQKKLHG